MSEDQEHDCNDPNCIAAAIHNTLVRQQVDEEGEQYVHRGDLMRMIDAIISVQESASIQMIAMNPMDVPNVALNQAVMASQAMLRDNLEASLERQTIEAPTAASLPDTVPESWGTSG